MRLFLCYVAPPLAVLFMGRPFSAVMNFFMTCLFWYPGIRHALVVYGDWKSNRFIGAINNPKWAQEPKQPKPPGSLRWYHIVFPEIWVAGKLFGRGRSGEAQSQQPQSEDPRVGQNGTVFRQKR